MFFTWPQFAGRLGATTAPPTDRASSSRQVKASARVRAESGCAGESGVTQRERKNSPHAGCARASPRAQRATCAADPSRAHPYEWA